MEHAFGADVVEDLTYIYDPATPMFADGPLDNGLTLRPFLRLGDELLLVNPTEVAACLRGQLFKLAFSYGCLTEFGALLGDATRAQIHRMISVTGAEAISDYQHVNNPVTQRSYLSAAGSRLHVYYVLDTLADLNPDDLYGIWGAPLPDLAAAAVLEKCVDLQSIQGVTHTHLIIFDAFGRSAFMGMRSDLPEGVLGIQAADVETMVAIDSHPLMFQRFAQALDRLSESAQVLSYSALDTFAVWKENSDSFYLSDDGAPTFVSFVAGTGGPLRLQAWEKTDQHLVEHPNGRRYIPALSRYGTDVAPLYGVMSPDFVGIVELPDEEYSIWVELLECDHLGPQLCDDVVELVGYWLWQIAAAHPLLLCPPQRGDVTIVFLDASQVTVENGQGQSASDPARFTAAIEGPGVLRVAGAGSLAQALQQDPTNYVDRELVRAIATALVPTTAVTALVERVAPAGQKTMMSVILEQDVLMWPIDEATPIAVPEALISKLLDDLGSWLAEQGHTVGPIKSEARTQVLNSVVAHYFTQLTQAIANLSPVGLLVQLVQYDEALVVQTERRRRGLASRLACFGHSMKEADRLHKEMQADTNAHVASRFLIEYVAAQPPSGADELTRDMYEWLLAIASDLTSKGHLSDALQYELAEARLSILESGRLGIDREDRYQKALTSWTRDSTTRVIESALGPDATGRPVNEGEIEEPVALSGAFLAEYGFSLHAFRDAVYEIISWNWPSSTGMHSLPISEFLARLLPRFDGDAAQAAAFLNHLSLRPRKKFFPEQRADTYPWRYTRDLSYVRRPLLISHEDGQEKVSWGPRRLYMAGMYWIDGVTSTRFAATSTQMQQVASQYRNRVTSAFNDRVASCVPTGDRFTTQARVLKIDGRRITDSAGQDLGDIDVLVVDRQARRLLAVEAKDFELARTPAELSNEISKLEDASRKHARRVQWLRERRALIGRHFGLPVNNTWEVLGVIVASRHLVAPRVQDTALPVIAAADFSHWLVRAQSKGTPTPRRRRR